MAPSSGGWQLRLQRQLQQMDAALKTETILCFAGRQGQPCRRMGKPTGWLKIQELAHQILCSRQKIIAEAVAWCHRWPCYSMSWSKFFEHGLPSEAQLLARRAGMEDAELSQVSRTAVGVQGDHAEPEASLGLESGSRDCEISPATLQPDEISEKELLLTMSGDGGDDGWSEPFQNLPCESAQAPFEPLPGRLHDASPDCQSGCSRGPHITASKDDPHSPEVLGFSPLLPGCPEEWHPQFPPPADEVPWPPRVVGPPPAQVPSPTCQSGCSSSPHTSASKGGPHTLEVFGCSPLPPVWSEEWHPQHPSPADAMLQLLPLRMGGGPGLDGLLEGIVAQLLPMITEMIQKAIAEALGQGLMPDAGSNAAGSATSLAEPKLKRHKGGGRDPKRKAPEATEPPSGRGAPRAEADSTSGGNRRVVRGKGAGGQPAVLTSVAPAAPADGGWQTVQRRKEEHEPFELRGQDWDVPIVPHDAIGRKLDDLPDGKPLEAVILASKTNLDTVRTILQGTSKPHRIMCVELKKDGKERIPGKVGNQLRFKQADITTHFSQGTAAPRYAGKKAAAVTIAPTTTTTTVYIRIPAAFCSAERWKEIRGSPAKTVAAWAAEHRVILADSWGWVEETLPKQGKQLFGKARLAEKEMSSLLCCSGRGGIFVDCIRDAIPAQVQWLARIDNEPATAYLERGLRMSAQLGLASQGGRIGARSARDPNAAIPRIWVLPHVPADWGPPEVTQVLTQSFDDITLIHHRRTGREQLYRFRGKHKFGDRDIVPLQVQLEEDGNKNEITMWATIAPVKTPSNKQTWLRNQAVPLIEPKPPALKVTPVKAPQAQAGQESGEAQQPANMRAVSHRQLPDGVRIEEAPKDGSCFYHSMAQGLQWLTGKSYCHRDLRAKANQHIEKHLTEYLPEFDGQGPSHEKLREQHPGDDSAALKAYLKLAACESAYASNLEIKALSMPRDPRFGIITFKESRRAKTIALWLTPKHVDLLLPADKDAKYPAELFTPSPGQIIDLRAGGRSSGDAASVCSAVSSAASQWTRASDAVSSARPAQVRSQAPSSRKRPRPEMSQAANQHESDAASIRTGTVWSSVPADSQKPRGKATTGKRTAPKTVWTSHRPPASTSRSVASGGAEATDVEDLHIPEVPAESSAARCRKDRAPDRFRTPQGPDMKYRMLFKCELCPFRATRVGANNMSALKAHHMNTCHDGAGQLPKTDSNQWFANRGKAEDFHWRCPLCRIGIKKVRSEISDSRIFQLQRMHKDQYHPEVSKSKWRVLKKAQKPTDSESRRRRAANLAKSNVKAIRLKLPPHLIPFTMPKAERLQRKGPVAERPITKLRLCSYYKCRRCGHVCHRGPKILKAHSGASCPNTRPDWVMHRALRNLDALSTWAKTHKVSGMPRTQLEEIFASARQAVQELPSQSSSLF